MTTGEVVPGGLGLLPQPIKKSECPVNCGSDWLPM